jgi:hypothetical protein
MERNWRGQAWSNATHASVTDPDARLYRKAKGRPAQLCYMGHALTENRHGFVIEAELTLADGTAERRAGIRLTLAADKGHGDQGFVAPSCADRDSRQDDAARFRARGRPVHAHHGRLQSREAAEAARRLSREATRASPAASRCNRKRGRPFPVFQRPARWILSVGREMRVTA